MRVVLDTNVLVSAFQFEGIPWRILIAASREAFVLYLSRFILDATRRVLMRKFSWSQEMVREVTDVLEEMAVMVEPRIKINVVKRKDADNRILECAMAVRADYLVSGDKRDLLSIKHTDGVVIISPGEFLRMFKL